MRCLLSLVLILWASAAIAQPYPASIGVTGISFDWSTHASLAPGSDNWPVTWSDDGHQYTAWGDGGGFGGTDQDGRVSLGVGRVEGDFASYTGFNVWGGKDPENTAQFEGKSYGIVSIAGDLYMWVTPGSGTTGYDSATLYKSTDKSATWATTGVEFVKADDIVVPTILNFGEDYDGARDGFVYHYFIELEDDTALTVQNPGNVHLARVAIANIETEGSYEWFNGTPESPSWTSTLASSVPVFTDATNGVGWNLSVSYNPNISRYLLITEHSSTFNSNLGIFDAPEPWGPWTTVAYETNWDDGGASPIGHDTEDFFWNFSNKWASGNDFVMVFTGVTTQDRWNVIEGTFTPGYEDGIEQRCIDLGPTDCVCSEQLDTTTVNTGLNILTALGETMDPDDSPDITECSFMETVNHAEGTGVDFRPQFIAASGEPLPSGHSLTNLIHSANDKTMHIVSTSPNYTSSATYCVRGYIREGTTHQPDAHHDNEEEPGNSQLKVQDIGGDSPTGFDVWQFHWQNTGTMRTRSDSNTFGINSPDSSLGDLNIDECRDNYCRMEICVDWEGPNLDVDSRFRVTVLEPHATPRVVNGSYLAINTLTPTAWDNTQQGPFTMPIKWFSQNIPDAGATRYGTHAMVAQQQPVDKTFWIGAACEVEGGCAGAAPPAPVTIQGVTITENETQ